MRSLLSLGKYWAIEPDTFNNLEALVSRMLRFWRIREPSESRMEWQLSRSAELLPAGWTF